MFWTSPPVLDHSVFDLLKTERSGLTHRSKFLVSNLLSMNNQVKIEKKSNNLK